MKHTKKLIPALGMLLLSACMLITSTFAWFSVNETVDATGMSVAAVGDQVYLQIVDATKPFTTTDAHKTTEGSVKLASGTGLTPATVVKKITDFGVGVDTIDPYTGGEFSWVTNTSNDANVSAHAGKYTEANTTSYYLLNQFKVRLNPDAGKKTADNPLRVSSIGFTGTSDALGKCVSVLVVGETGTATYAQLWKQDAGGNWSETGNKQLTASAFAYADTPLTVSVYVFFDGENSNCTINNLSTASNSYTIAVNFTVKAATQG